ncbi:PDDEXK nuclease domain-containing protein [Dyadobacter sp. LJ419]|uniref:PDDEXK nuclease domain-containing protein n=1 Tax=Dyadobacter chenwenxiniae TaxID=2906456 RepID=A0A9X1PQY2_9BACT|nr:PDDEXK nuclease domain-containing protein [Dyadobacter chenwenxiniae]MCF0065805.1 PDDEXK nuclease domain-containing protein [Dyadobacter chenwenxiniae]
MSLDNSQIQFISDIKEKVRAAQYEALKAVNAHLLNLYWELSKAISEKQASGWSKSIVSSLSSELQREFPAMSGFSVANLWLISQFYSEYSVHENLVPLVREISWTKDVLTNQIENNTYEKYLLNQTNFEDVLPENLKKQAYLAVKDNYTFDFLNLADKHSESDLEESLIKNIREFLLEMGSDFTFVGNQYKVLVDKREYKIDLLLYHRKLQSLIAIDLKIGEFEPEHKGKMEFYLSVLNDKVRLPHENPAIGIIICKSKNRTIVEYSLRTATLPIGAATYQTTSSLPAEYQALLPSANVISQKLMHLLDSNH